MHIRQDVVWDVVLHAYENAHHTRDPNSRFYPEYWNQETGTHINNMIRSFCIKHDHLKIVRSTRAYTQVLAERQLE